jgi:hypothetical protein
MVGLLVCWDDGIYQVGELRRSTWSSEAAVGFLGSTPDRTTFATNLNANWSDWL